MFFHNVYKSRQIFLPFCHNSRVWKTDGQTDRILIARPRLHSIQRGKKWETWLFHYRPTLALPRSACSPSQYSPPPTHTSSVVDECRHWNVRIGLAASVRLLSFIELTEWEKFFLDLYPNVRVAYYTGLIDLELGLLYWKPNLCMKLKG